MTDLIPDGEGHFTLNMPPVLGYEVMHSFTWNGDVNSPILVSKGGYAEPVIGEFEMPMSIYDPLIQVAMDTGNTATLAVVVMTAFETACMRWMRTNGGDSQ